VLTTHLLALLRGSAVPQAQNASDTADPSVIVDFDGDDITSAARTFSGTDLAAEPGLTVRIVRALRPAESDGCATTGARGMHHCRMAHSRRHPTARLPLHRPEVELGLTMGYRPTL
jgi:hypothetical protein